MSRSIPLSGRIHTDTRHKGTINAPAFGIYHAKWWNPPVIGTGGPIPTGIASAVKQLTMRITGPTCKVGGSALSSIILPCTGRNIYDLSSTKTRVPLLGNSSIKRKVGVLATDYTIAYSSSSGSKSGLTCALPTGTQAGDLLVASAFCHNNGYIEYIQWVSDSAVIGDSIHYSSIKVAHTMVTSDRTSDSIKVTMITDESVVLILTRLRFSYNSVTVPYYAPDIYSSDYDVATGNSSAPSITGANTSHAGVALGFFRQNDNGVWSSFSGLTNIITQVANSAGTDCTGGVVSGTHAGGTTAYPSWSASFTLGPDDWTLLTRVFPYPITPSHGTGAFYPVLERQTTGGMNSALVGSGVVQTSGKRIFTDTNRGFPGAQACYGGAIVNAGGVADSSFRPDPTTYEQYPSSYIRRVKQVVSPSKLHRV